MMLLTLTNIAKKIAEINNRGLLYSRFIAEGGVR
jgi:hypothetical protein